MVHHAVTHESWASIFVIGCMIVGSIGVTVAVVVTLVLGIRRVATLNVGPGHAAVHRCPNGDCGCGNPLSAVYCRRCGGRLNAEPADDRTSGAAKLRDPDDARVAKMSDARLARDEAVLRA